MLISSSLKVDFNETHNEVNSACKRLVGAHSDAQLGYLILVPLCFFFVIYLSHSCSKQIT